MISRSKRAFQLCAGGIAERFPILYFWTVTFAVVHDDWQCSQLFRRFLDHLKKDKLLVGCEFGGLRVAELHKKHGVHYHLLVNTRVSVHIVRRIGRCYGIGRVNVKRVWDNEGAIAYLAKYLSKRGNGVPLCESGRKMRRWAAFGEVPRVRVSDVVFESEMSIWRRAQNLPWLGYRKEFVVRRAWDEGPEACKAVWFLLRGDGSWSDALALATGRLEVRGLGEWVEREKFSPPLWGAGVNVPGVIT